MPGIELTASKKCIAKSFYLFIHFKIKNKIDTFKAYKMGLLIQHLALNTRYSSKMVERKNCRGWDSNPQSRSQMLHYLKNNSLSN